MGLKPSGHLSARGTKKFGLLEYGFPSTAEWAPTLPTKIGPQKIRGKSPKSGETSNPLIPGNFAEACSGSNPDFEVEFRTVREAKAESSARELRVRQLPLIDGLEGLTHNAFKFAAVAATGKEVDQDLG